jgi:hypothetical protein
LLRNPVAICEEGLKKAPSTSYDPRPRGGSPTKANYLQYLPLRAQFPRESRSVVQWTCLFHKVAICTSGAQQKICFNLPGGESK